MFHFSLATLYFRGHNKFLCKTVIEQINGHALASGVTNIVCIVVELIDDNNEM